MHRIADEAASTPAKTPAQRDAALLAVPELARKCVAAALRTSGLGVDDARVDDIVSRSRSSAWLPETRMRAMRLWDDAAHATTLATTKDTTYYDALGANLALDLRLTWRLDRLLFAGDEPTFERVRLERQDARARGGPPGHSKSSSRGSAPNSTRRAPSRVRARRSRPASAAPRRRLVLRT